MNKKRFVNIPSAVIDVTVIWIQIKILQEKTKWTVCILKFHTQLDYKLTYANKNQTEITLT